MKRVEAIGLLRIFATLSVFLLHVTVFSPQFGITREVVPPWLFFVFPSSWVGVDIFFVLSGYLAALGFRTGRYENPLAYYKKRFFTILLPAWIYLAICIALFYPDLPFNHPDWILSFIFCYHNGSGSVDGIGALWYVFTSCWLFLLSPFADKLFMRLSGKYVNLFGKKRRLLHVIWFALLIGGFLYRIALSPLGSVGWYSWVYTPFWSNLDLYFCGMLTVYLPRLKLDKNKIISAFVTYVIINAFLNYCTADNPFILNVLGLPEQSLFPKICCYFLWYIMPTVGILITVSILLTYNTMRKENVVDKIADYTYPFYLVHSIILAKLAPWIAEMGRSAKVSYVALVVLGFALSCLFAFLFHTLMTLPKVLLHKQKIMKER